MLFVRTIINGKAAVAILAKWPFFYYADTPERILEFKRSDKTADALFPIAVFENGTTYPLDAPAPRKSYTSAGTCDGQWLPEDEDKIMYLIDGCWAKLPNKKTLKEKFFNYPATDKHGLNVLVPAKKAIEQLYHRVLEHLLNIYQ